MAVDLTSPHLTVEYGLDLLDSDNAWIMDLSDDLLDGSLTVERDAERTIHGTCSFAITRELDWGAQRVRPSITVVDADGGESTWHLGVYVLETPERRIAETPESWTVQGYDLTAVLDTPHGAGFSTTTADTVVDVVTELVEAAVPGASVSIDYTAATCAAASWPLDESTTTLQIVNGVLGMAGYGPIWTDRDGTFRATPAVLVSGLSSVATLSADGDGAVVDEDRTVVQDLWAAPNVWTFFFDTTTGDIPVDGAGQYVVTNNNDGPSSVNGRGGRVVRKVVRLDVPDQATLESVADTIVEADKAQGLIVRCTSTPQPDVWHGSPVRYTDSAAALDQVLAAVRWRLADSRHEFELVAGWRQTPPPRPQPQVSMGVGEVIATSPDLKVRFAGDTQDVDATFIPSGYTLNPGDRVLLAAVGGGFMNQQVGVVEVLVDLS